jgi:hypothetical protein
MGDKPNFRTLGEFLAEGPPPVDRSRWGGWRLENWGERGDEHGHPGGWHLVYSAYPGGGRYPVELERFASSGNMLDMVMQVAGKRWVDDACLAGFVRALNDILAPQANLCTFGANKTMTRERIATLAEAIGEQSVA